MIDTILPNIILIHMFPSVIIFSLHMIKIYLKNIFEDKIDYLLGAKK